MQVIIEVENVDEDFFSKVENEEEVTLKGQAKGMFFSNNVDEMVQKASKYDELRENKMEEK